MSSGLRLQPPRPSYSYCFCESEWPVLFEKVQQWCPEADDGLGLTLREDRATIVDGVNSGRLELWRLNAGAAWMVTRIDAGELIVCCVQGSGLRELARLVYRIAKDNQLRAVRFFTERPALAERLLNEFPVKLLGYVYSCTVVGDAERMQ